MFLYRLLLSLFALWTLPGALRSGTARDRLGLTPAASGPHVWLHGASNGELASVRPVLEHLVRARPDLSWLITANTATGVALAQGWALPRVTVRLAPLDLAQVTRRMMRRWSVCAHITLESEIWPHRILSCPGPVILLGARMTPGTARSWARVPGLARRILSRLTFVSAQDTGSRDRLAALGVPPTALGPTVDLKAFYSPPPPVADDTGGAFDRGKTWLAASTHPKEEETVLAAHAALLAADPDQRLILAPRHPARGDEIAALVRRSGLTCARRSHDEAPGAAQVYLADTMGEMALWYALAGRVFVGGTLTDRGGHTPYEPAAFGAALLHGPDTRNFTPAFTRLAQARAAVETPDARALADGLIRLSDPAAQTRNGEAARQTLHPKADAGTLGTRLAALLPRP